MSKPIPIHTASLAALTVLAALTQAGCSGGCSDDPWLAQVKPISFQAWEKSGRTSCDPTKFSAGLTGGADKCPVGDAARDYILNCNTSVVADRDRVDRATLNRYDASTDTCIYDVRGERCR